METEVKVFPGPYENKIAELKAAADDMNINLEWLSTTAPGTHITVHVKKLLRLLKAVESFK